ncbi:hypothetical protein VdG1_01084 [Verticillium dahliae VDG1]|nr:hypothetical protein VdG1_01084 [Verticillium dahliae VDG1]
MLESAATSFASILVLAAGFGIAGYAYHKSYKRIVLNKMANAFEPGDPVLDLAAIGKEVPMTPADMDDRWVNRPEQLRVDQIVQGEEVGHYHLLIGDKGTGKSSMLIEAMRKIDGDGVAMFEAHADLEIVRIRLGKALDFEFHEDYIGGYFSERGPRDTTALLDIERALNKLEKVALLKRAERKKPLVLIINQMHLIRDDDDGKDLIELLQQRAEQWAAANLVTMVFNSDDFWVYERLKQLATRMEVIPVLDLPKAQASIALQKYRVRYFGQQVSARELEEVYDLVAEMDDDVMDQQKWASAAMVLAQALVQEEPNMDATYDAKIGHILPSFPLHIAQQRMTRADFIRQMDRLNLFSITSEADVRASSVPMHHAFRQICSEPGFNEHLEATTLRIADIESLGRQRELVAKDLVLGGHYEIAKQGSNGFTVKVVPGEDRGMYPG